MCWDSFEQIYLKSPKPPIRSPRQLGLIPIDPVPWIVLPDDTADGGHDSAIWAIKTTSKIKDCVSLEEGKF